MKAVLAIVAALILVGIAGVAAVLLLNSSPQGVSIDGVVFEVKSGENLAAIAAGLDEAGLIRSRWLLRAVARIEGTEASLKAGFYRIRAGWSTTAVHDLLRFVPDMDQSLPSLAAGVLVRYTLPALVLLPLLWGRLEPPQQLTALLVVLLFVGARALHLLMVTRLTIDQLYANWRGVGELIIMTLWALGLALAFALWWSGRWADGIALAGRGRRAVASE